VTWATSVAILVFLGLSVLDLGPMYATDRWTDVRRASSLKAHTLGAGHNKAPRNITREQAEVVEPRCGQCLVGSSWPGLQWSYGTEYCCRSVRCSAGRDRVRAATCPQPHESASVRGPLCTPGRHRTSRHVLHTNLRVYEVHSVHQADTGHHVTCYTRICDCTTSTLCTSRTRPPP